jgi:hypothetical protein
MKRSLLGLTLFAVCAAGIGCKYAAPVATGADVFKSEMAPKGAMAYIISPADGATVGTTFTIQFGLKGMGVAPAGVKNPATGHHHLLIDAKAMPAMDKPMAASDSLKHYGGGQTEVSLTLKPGKHTLQLILGNYVHVPHNKPVTSKKITITVK